MKFLITTDFHASRPALLGLNKLLEQQVYDAVLSLGDLINPDNRELPYIEEFINLIQSIHKLPLFAVHGNNEPEPAYQIYRKKEVNVHLETRLFGGYNICGIGGLGYLNESGFEDLSVENLIINERTIFLTHIPPRNSETTNGPLVHLFGHKHVQAYTKRVEATLQIQCPAGNLGRVTEFDLPELAVRFIDLPTT